MPRSLRSRPLSRVEAQRMQGAQARAGSLERAWVALGKVIGGVWQTIRNIGRDDLAFRLSKTTDEDRIGNEWRELGDLGTLDQVLASGDVDNDTKNRIRTLRQEQAALQREANAEQAKAQAQAAVQAKQTAGINALGRAREALGQDRAVAKAQELKQLTSDIAVLRATGVKTVEGIPVESLRAQASRADRRAVQGTEGTACAEAEADRRRACARGRRTGTGVAASRDRAAG